MSLCENEQVVSEPPADSSKNTKPVKQKGSRKIQFEKHIFFACALLSIVAVAAIVIFIFINSVPAFSKIGFFQFIFGTKWFPDGYKTDPSNASEYFGIFPMIIGSIYVTAGAIIVGVPIGILTAIFMSRFCPKKLYKIIKPAVGLLAGIPSIVYGFFALVVMVPIAQDLFGGSGKGILTASVLLGLMILPTIIEVSESALNAVPESYYEGSLALGATHERSVFKAMLPAAKSGMLAGIILGIGRAIGETMAVVMIAGNSAIMPESITSGVRTLTSNIVLEMAYASGLHEEALIATACVLFVFILLINLCFSMLKKKEA